MDKKISKYIYHGIEEFFNDFISANNGKLESDKLPTGEIKTFKINEETIVSYRRPFLPTKLEEITVAKEIEFKKGGEYYQITKHLANNYILFMHFTLDESIPLEEKILEEHEIIGKLKEACEKFGLTWPDKFKLDYIS